MNAPMLKPPTLGEIAMELLELARQMRDEGATVDEVNAYVERGLRSAWPSVREWKYLCDDCSDTGWKHGICSDRNHCGRPFKLPNQRGDDYTGRGQCRPGHDFVRPCYCKNGRDRYTDLYKTRQAEDFTTAGKTKPMTRLGR